VQRFNLRNIAIVAVITFAGGFLLGFIPQFRSASGLRDGLRQRDERIHTLERDAKLSRARDLASLLYLELTRKNYGIAAQHAIALFDHVRSMRSDLSPQSRSDLDKILSQRDAVTASIAKSEPEAVNLVQQVLDQFHKFKGP
jgi:hypothetical protein